MKRYRYFEVDHDIKRGSQLSNDALLGKYSLSLSDILNQELKDGSLQGLREKILTVIDSELRADNDFIYGKRDVADAVIALLSKEGE